MYNGVIGALERQAGFQVREARLQVTLPDELNSQPKVRRRMVRLMFQRETVVLDRFLNAPKVLQEITQARVGIGVRGVDLEHPSKGLLGIPQQAFPQQNRAVSL